MEDEKKLVKVLVEHDEMPAEEGPNSWGGWRLYSFNRRHASFIHPDEYDKTFLEERLKRGEVFPLSYYEHGNCIWTLMGELPAMCQCPWDSVNHAGWLEMEDDFEFPDRDAAAVSARSFLETYTDWANGNVYMFSFPEDEDRESYGGLIGLEDVMHGIADAMEDDEEPEFVGCDTSWLEQCWQKVRDERNHARENVELPDPAGTSGGV